jgi:HPt (histidine-containing phosphotransfer) domain-containing protein
MSEPQGTPVPVGLPAAGLLDEQALASLRALDPGGNANLLARVLATYTQSLQRLLEQLRAARESADLQGQRHVAHTLKSSSASVGALKLSALCAEIERALREAPADGSMHSVNASMDTLDEEGEHLLAALRQSLATTS